MDLLHFIILSIGYHQHIFLINLTLRIMPHNQSVLLLHRIFFQISATSSIYDFLNPHQIVLITGVLITLVCWRSRVHLGGSIGESVTFEILFELSQVSTAWISWVLDSCELHVNKRRVCKISRLYCADLRSLILPFGKFQV